MRSYQIVLFHQQQGLCAYCEIDLLSLPIEQVTLDHIKPKSKGGRGNKNYCFACRACNQLKGSNPPEEFKKWISEHKDAMQAFNKVFHLS